MAPLYSHTLRVRSMIDDPGVVEDHVLKLDDTYRLTTSNEIRESWLDHWTKVFRIYREEKVKTVIGKPAEVVDSDEEEIPFASSPWVQHVFVPSTRRYSDINTAPTGAKCTIETGNMQSSFVSRDFVVNVLGYSDSDFRKLSKAEEKKSLSRASNESLPYFFARKDKFNDSQFRRGSDSKRKLKANLRAVRSKGILENEDTWHALQGNIIASGQHLLLGDGRNRNGRHGSDRSILSDFTMIHTITTVLAGALGSLFFVRLNQIKDLYPPSNLLLNVPQTISSSVPWHVFSHFADPLANNEKLLFSLFALCMTLYYSLSFLFCVKNSRKTKTLSLVITASTLLIWTIMGAKAEELFLVFLPQCISFGIICGCIFEHFIGTGGREFRVVHLHELPAKGDSAGGDDNRHDEKKDEEFGDEKTGLKFEV